MGSLPAGMRILKPCYRRRAAKQALVLGHLPPNCSRPQIRWPGGSSQSLPLSWMVQTAPKASPDHTGAPPAKRRERCRESAAAKGCPGCWGAPVSCWGVLLLLFLTWRAAGREAVAGAQALMTLGPSYGRSCWNWPWLSQLLGLKAPAQEAEQDHSPWCCLMPTAKQLETLWSLRHVVL